MAFHLPEYIDELIDAASDPLCLLLSREGSEDEAYQTAMYHRAGQQQIITRCELEQRPYEDEDYELPRRRIGTKRNLRSN